VNLILFEAPLPETLLRGDDPRARHVRDVLRRRPGDTFDCGAIDGPRGKATVVADTAEGLRLRFAWESAPPPPLDPIVLLVGLPRPQTARKILREATALGLSRFRFFASGRGEPGYAASSLWRGDAVRRLLIEGAEQAFCTRLPEVALHASLSEALEAEATANATRVALDNYEAPRGLGALPAEPHTPVIVAVGSERGWTADERDSLRRARFELRHLGPRVLRTETACVAALAIIRERLGRYR